MAISTRFVRAQLKRLKPTLARLTIEKARIAQDNIGELMAYTRIRKVRCSLQQFVHFDGEWIFPKKRKQAGVILYLHGGGYTAGSLKYARGFGSVLAERNNMDTFCAAYRLAPEHPFPAALADALEAYQYLLDEGYGEKGIILCGESAGGGLIFALTLKIQELGLTMPKGLVAISPWVDLTMSGESIEENREYDPSLAPESLRCFAEAYAPKDPKDPLASPVFAHFTDMPPSMIFVGSSEILLDDAVRLHERLTERGNRSTLFIQKDMWHAYVLYGVREAREDLGRMNQFIKEVLK